MTDLQTDAARYEVKFVGNVYERDTLLRWLMMHPYHFHRAYPSRVVNNVYFDSLDLNAFDDNVAGLSQRIKHRLRWYGDSLLPEQAKWEAKIKRNRLGWKLSQAIPELPDFRHTRWNTISEHILAQLPEAHRIRFAEYATAAVINRYTREYYESLNGKVRVTLDTEHQAYGQRFHSRPNIRWRDNVPSPLIVEVKFAEPDYRHGKEVIRDIPLRTSRHSKYVVNMEASLGR